MSRLAPRFAHIQKALAPFVLAAATALAQWIATSDLDVAELRTIAAGAVMALVVYWVPNEPRDTGDLAYVPRRQRKDRDDGSPEDYADPDPLLPAP
jgi:hypothetical protein